jgi:hypothetical protein
MHRISEPGRDAHPVSEPSRSSDSRVHIERREIPSDIQKSIEKNLDLGRSAAKKQKDSSRD